ALNNHKKGYNCAQSVLCAFTDLIGYDEDGLFKLSEAFGGGIGGTGNICGAVSAIVMIAGITKSAGVSVLPVTNKKNSYETAAMLMEKFNNMNKSLICSEIKNKGLRSCDGCIEDAVRILEKYFETI
ncbi:MAG: C_GCAxxG_C_C family protein, partial [Clostridia bacterium]|nr:C_GCAxxG_C_C family protein [Clostridia bacterium]